jgi:hypothetical protein
MVSQYTLDSNSSAKYIAKALEHCYNSPSVEITWMDSNVRKLRKIIDKEYWDCTQYEIQNLFNKIWYHDNRNATYESLQYNEQQY